MTLEEWAALDEDEPGELVDGRLEEEEMPTFLHEAAVAWLVRVLGTWAVLRGAWVFGSDARVAISPKRGRKPDVSVFLRERAPSRGSSVARVAPWVVVEVLSAGARNARRDRVEKLQDYRACGVRFYWLLDPEARLFEVMELREDGSNLVALAVTDGAHPAPGCEGLSLSLDELWAELDRLPADPPGSDDA